MAKVQISLRGRRILVVDDNELSREVLKHRFEALGATVYVANSHERTNLICQGLASQGVRPDLILADPLLNSCYGLQLLQIVKDALGLVPVPTIVVSSGFNQFALQRMKFYGVVAFIQKPVHIDAIFECAIEVLAELSHEVVEQAEVETSAPRLTVVAA